MSILISIDPGCLHAGIAYWHDSILKEAALLIQEKTDSWLRFTDWLPRNMIGPWKAVIEVPQIYPGSVVRHEDLIQLAASAGAIAGALRASGCIVEQARPGIWTRQTCTNKKIRLERAWAKLTEEERNRVILPKSKLRQEDVKDAISLGLWKLKRW